MWPPLRITPVPVLFGLFCCSAPVHSAHRSVEYLYVNASEGSASGGHAAIKFGDDVYHFQHVPPGLLRITKDAFGWFRYRYGYQENRTIRGHRIEVSDETFQWLADAFRRRTLVQDEQFEQMRAIDRDRRLLSSLRLTLSHGKSGDGPSIDLKGLGFFVSGRWRPTRDLTAEPQSAAMADPSLIELRQFIESQNGAGFLQTKRRQVWDTLQRPWPESGLQVSADIDEDRFTPARPSFAQAYTDGLTNLAALDVLAGAMPLRPAVIRQSFIPQLKLKPKEAAALADFRRRLIADLVGLMHSRRADWGFPLLVGMARLGALDSSLASGYLAVLDRFEGGEQRDEPGSGFRAALFDQARQDLTTAKSDLRPDERAYGRLEEAANRFAELRDAMLEGRPARLFTSSTVPLRPAAAEWISPAISPAQLKAQLDDLKTLGDRYEERLRALYAYDLLRRNCVTEIFRVINDAVARQVDDDQMARAGGDLAPETRPARIRAESWRRLGGYVDEAAFNPFPFVAFETVGKTYRVVGSEVWPSYRDLRIRQDAGREPALLVAARESNVISSTLYRHNDDDAAFLFFTDDVVWARPLLGGVNLAVAAGQSAVGILSSPWDSGAMLRNSLKGMLVSVPELFFFNIRKGSFPHLPPVNLAE